MMSRREKVFGPGRAVPLDRNAKCRVEAYAKAWSRQNCQPGQQRARSPEPSWTSCTPCSGSSSFPSYERIAEKAECCRRTVAEALKVLEWAGVLTWQHRITRVRERCRDLFGREGWRWRVIRTSNDYQFHDPQQRLASVPASKCKNSSGTLNQDISKAVQAPAIDPTSPLERALARYAAAIAAKHGIEQEEAG